MCVQLLYYDTFFKVIKDLLVSRAINLSFDKNHAYLSDNEVDKPHH